jgi:3-oxoacyl-[acyl-carrier protein] reductase
MQPDQLDESARERSRLLREATSGSLAGRIALVTGASRRIGIGAAMARALAARGADVFITYYRPYDAKQPWNSTVGDVDHLLAELRDAGVRTGHMELDLSDPAAPAQLFDSVENELGTPHILVNNAAAGRLGGIDTLDAAMLDEHYAVNVRAMALLCAEFVRRFTAGQGGRIINLTSGQSLGAMSGELAYAASKGAVEAFTLSLSDAVMRRGITVNAIDPGATDTGWMTDSQKAAWIAHAPGGRLGLPEDAARLAAFLASDEAQWITGQILHSRGGA